MLDEVAPPDEAPAVRGYLEEFMARPACVFQKPDVLRAVLGCLPFGDLQMVLAYVVRQHADAMAALAAEEEGEEDEEEDVGGSSEEEQEEEEQQQDRMLMNVALGGTGGSSRHGGRRHRKQSRGNNGEGVGDEGSPRARRKRHHHAQQDMDGTGSEACTDDLVLAEPPAPPPLFELHVPDVGALHALVADVWNRDDSVEDGPAGGAAGGAQHSGGAKARAHANQSAGALAAGDLDDLLLLTGLQMENGGCGGGAAGGEADTQPWLSPVSWWMDHLTSLPTSSTTSVPVKQQAGRQASADDGGAAALKWVYSKIVCRPAEEFQARQRELRAGRERDAAVYDLYEDLAYAWRSLQGALDSRARLEELRKGARAQFALVKQIEEEGRHCNAEEAAEFLEVLMASHYAAAGAAGAQLAEGQILEQPRLNMCEAAVDVVRRHPALAGTRVSLLLGP